MTATVHRGIQRSQCDIRGSDTTRRLGFGKNILRTEDDMAIKESLGDNDGI